MSMQLLKREIEAEIESLENRKKVKKSDQGQEKALKREKKKKVSGKQRQLSVKLCNVDYKKEKDFTKEGLEMIGRHLLKVFFSSLVSILKLSF